MAFSKTFPRNVEGSNYPRWEEVFLAPEEEAGTEQEARKANIQLMKECIDEARGIMNEKGLKQFQNDLINIAIALFEKRASHVIYWKEEKAKEKFDKA